jgi:EAL domain-containing protein (putative c-di-GMP-specific phosphodiesterase class I)
MYVPIILAGVFIHPIFGAFIGLFGGLMLGPIMPIDTITNEPQLAINWIFRLIVFIGIGILTGWGSRRIISLQMHNQDTGLPNANYYQHAIKKLKPGKQAVLTLFIGNHQDIVDVLGISMYHALIKQIFELTLKTLPAPAIVIQVDNNRFWIISSTGDVAKSCENLMKTLKDIHAIDNQSVYMEFTLGAYSAMRLDSCETTSVFIYSDNAIRIALETNLQFYMYEDEGTQKRFQYELLMSFKQALKNKDFYLVYQPQIDLTTNCVNGFEALIRWKHADRGVIPPGEFIPLVEKTWFINDLTLYVIEHTCQTIATLHDLGFKLPLSFNISSKNLYDPLFFEKAYDIIRKSKIPTELIRMEVTESALMENPEKSAEILNMFTKHGIHVLIDDFGTGYSSLSYLSRYPVHTIKIDQYFIKNLDQNQSVHKIVKATVQLAHELGCRVLAEGVERETLLHEILKSNFDEAQGYYYAYPMTLVEAVEYLKTNKQTN